MNTPSLRSALGPEISSYLDRQRALGFKYDYEASILEALDRFLSQHGHTALTANSFAAWALTLERLTPQGRRKKMQIVRRFTLYCRRSTADCFVPDPAQFPSPAAPPAPWILSSQQVLTLLEQAGQLPAPTHSPLCAAVYRMAVVLLYTTGLRRGELVRLRMGDYDRSRHTLLVQGSKFHKSRLVALSGDARRELAAYLRQRLCFPHTAQSPLLAHGRQAQQAYSGNGFGAGFRKLCRNAGVLTASGVAPRVHDLRHTYAVHVLLGCYRDDGRPQAVLPALSRAMGHVSPASTAYYLSWIDPVIEQAVARVERHIRPVLAASGGGSHD